MTRDRIYDVWRPEGSPWSPWVKPVLFSFLPAESGDSEAGVPVSGAGFLDVPLSPGSALIVDLPGRDSVATGLALAKTGYRPVPIYTACPPPHGGIPVAVEVEPILAALTGIAPSLAAVDLSADAPPAFLLDAGRGGVITPESGWFDNRSFVTASDFPSAAKLSEHGIERIVLLQAAGAIQADLTEVLLHWQRSGLAILRQNVDDLWRPEPATVRPAFGIRRLWQRLRREFGYPPNQDGTFGTMIRPTGG